MSKKAGVWIDHRKALIVILSEDGEETREIESGMEKHVRFAGGSHAEGSQTAEDMRDRGFTNHLDKYYDDVITILRDAEAIQIFGPGEAKGELEKRLASHKLGGLIVGIESADKMTDRQIAAQVRQRFEYRL